jgi:hypothetical protein
MFLPPLLSSEHGSSLTIVQSKVDGRSRGWLPLFLRYSEGVQFKSVFLVHLRQESNESMYWYEGKGVCDAKKEKKAHRSQKGNTAKGFRIMDRVQFSIVRSVSGIQTPLYRSFYKGFYPSWKGRSPVYWEQILGQS